MSLNGIWKQIEGLGRKFKNYLEAWEEAEKAGKRPRSPEKARRGPEEAGRGPEAQKRRGPEEAGKRSRSLEKL